jgi:5-methylcytosine-specific restriction endonuclease McrA
MASEATLVQSSPATRSWRQNLRDRLLLLQYNEVKYWASFRTETPRRVVAYANPSKLGVRVFLTLGPSSESDLMQTPSTSGWATRFPSVFQISGEQDLARAEQLIRTSSKVPGHSARKEAKSRPEYFAAEEVSPEVEYVEGAASRVLVNAYERNRRAREACLRHYGRSCAACGFNFEVTYGESTAGYIHVHHVIPIAQVGTGYRLHAINDLRPVCPNCHAAIHRREPPFSIEEIKHMLRNCSAKG